MIDKIISFGDSFTYGTDLSDSDQEKYSTRTWPALVAQALDLEYECHARGGVGNRFISDNTIAYSNHTSLSIVNWTWIDRFDYIEFDDEGVNHIRTLRPSDTSPAAEFYYKNLHDQQTDKFQTLSLAWSTINWLRHQKIPYVMTILDQLLLEDKWGVAKGTRYKRPAISNLQECVSRDLSWFPENQTFLEWSRDNNYPESDTWHPLEEAHARAAEIMLPVAKRAINTYITTT